MIRFAVLAALCVSAARAAYKIPDILIEPLSPRGFRASIPDEEGISLFAFHGKINEEMVGREAGEFSVDILKAKNGRWTFRDNSARLKPGDIIYYWYNVDYDDGNGKRGYIKDDLEFTVTELISTDSGTVVAPTTSSPTTKPTTKSTTKPPTESSVCKPTQTVVNGRKSCQGKLIFQDNFAELNNKKWLPEIKFAGDPDYEFVIYQDHKENLYTERNKLYVKPSLVENRYYPGFVSNTTGLNLGEKCTGVPESIECYQKPRAWVILPPVLSAQVTTRENFSFRYGVIEIRAKLPKGDWIYPELYLRPKTDTYGPGLDSGLIRVAFAPGNADSSSHLQGGCILGQSVTARNYGLRRIRSEKPWNDGFHMYRVEWKPDVITLIVDNHVYGNIYPPDDGFASEELQLGLEKDTVDRWKQGTDLAPFDQEMYVVLGVGAGGQCFDDRTDGTKPWENADVKAQLHFYRNQDNWSRTWSDNSALVVDYVNVWAL